MKKIYYFAYGSNMLFERVKYRLDYLGPKSKKVGTYKLPGYKLVLNCAAKYNFYSFANIVPQNDGVVEGVLYELSHEQMHKLDTYEALYERAYFTLPNGDIAFTYISHYADDTVKPELYYLNILIDGCIENNLLDTYEMLLDFKMKFYNLKKGSKHKPITK